MTNRTALLTSAAKMLRGPTVAYALDDTGPLSLDQAVETLTPKPAEEPAQEAPAEAAEGEAEPKGEVSSPGEAEDGAEPPAEAEETEGEGEPAAAADPPKYWPQEAKARFAELPPDLQAVVLSQEGPREEASAKARSERDAAVQAREARDAEVAKFAEVVGEALPRWIEAFQSKWGEKEPDWMAVATEHGSEAANLAKLAYEADRAKLVEAERARQQAESEALTFHRKTEAAKLQELAPDLMDPKDGPTKRGEVLKYMRDNLDGLDDATIGKLTAKEVILARKAMLYDRGQAALKTAPKKAAATPPKPAARPGAGSAASPSERTLASVQGAFNAKPDLSNAVALILAKGK